MLMEIWQPPGVLELLPFIFPKSNDPFDQNQYICHTILPTCTSLVRSAKSWTVSLNDSRFASEPQSYTSPHAYQTSKRTHSSNNITHFTLRQQRFYLLTTNTNHIPFRQSARSFLIPINLSFATEPKTLGSFSLPRSALRSL